MGSIGAAFPHRLLPRSKGGLESPLDTIETGEYLEFDFISEQKEGKMDSKQVASWDMLVARRISQHFRQFHAAESATLRRNFLRTVAGLGLGSGLLAPRLAEAAPNNALPQPIPGGVSPFGIAIHHFPLPPTGTPLSSINEPSEITDFNGFIGDTRIRGAGSGTGFATPLAFQTDMGFMQGEYIGQDGSHNNASFCFI
jgi:hypothetical protein